MEINQEKELLLAAKQALKNAYCPYSGFAVGAALRTRSGRIFMGCNVENASYGATLCAEQCAISKAVSEGEREFTAIAVVSAAGKWTPPCGICRQVLLEWMPEGQVVLEKEGEPVCYLVRDLLPAAFSQDNLSEE